MDDIGVKGPKTIYEGKEICSNIRRYVLKYIQFLDRILINIELSDCIISETKLKFCVFKVKIVKYVCDIEERRPKTAKIIKILEWPLYEDITEVRAFVGVCVYYRI